MPRGIKKTTGGNGSNGSGSHGKSKEAKLKRVKFGAKQMPEIGVIAGFVVQALRKPTFDEISDTIKDKLRATIHKATLKRSLEGLCKAKFITQGSASDEGGIGRFTYTVRTVWRDPPEMMYIKTLLPLLVSRPEAEQIMAWFNSQEDMGTKKAKSSNYESEFHFYRAHILTSDIWTGSMPGEGEVFNMIHTKFPTRIDKEEIPIKTWWDRDERTGLYRISPDVQQGWFGTNVAKYFKVGPWWGELIDFKPILFGPYKDTIQVFLPCTGGPRGQNAGPQYYEGLLPGQELVLEFTAATKNFLTPAQMEAFINLAGARPKRGLSPSRGRKYGRFAVIKFEDLGAVDKNDVGLALNDIPADIREKYSDYYDGLVKRIPTFLVQEVEVDVGPMPTDAN